MKTKAFISGIFLFLTSVLWSQTGSTAGKGAGTQASIYYSPENLRSDTFDILTYSISLEIGNSTNKQIKGNTKIRFAPKLNNRNFIRFDLLRLTIDSIRENNSPRSFFYNDTILRINFAAAKNVVDTSVIIVYYHGQPQMDATGWGGFYFDNTQGAEYAYNLGVGFGAKPHNYGRVWFPCFDNFVERSKYVFAITSDSTRRAYCNGTLTGDVVVGTKRTRTWVMNESMPTYLASVALANYRQVNWTVNTLTGVKPIFLIGHASDTAAMKNGFVNLKNCIQAFENYFGPYKWNRFGYCLVPFGSGAMEHATNIAYPRAAAGNLAFEADLMAHELSHHWWGDLITCETQEDMWINEGMATFSAYLFTEAMYGKQAYLTKLKTQHDNLLHFLHKKEGGFRAVSGVPHSLTYGDHVYLKGADMAHTLRGYMGDTAFFAACKYALQQNSYKHANSVDLKSLFQTSSNQNLNDFFSNWILSGGWPHFSLDSVHFASTNPNAAATVHLKQKLYGAPALYNNVPLEISFFKSDWTRVVRKVVMSGTTGAYTVAPIPFVPVWMALNYDSKISDASSHEAKVIKSTGNQAFTLGKVFLQVQNKGQDSSLIRVIHNYVAPDAFKNNPKQHKLSNQHYWKVEGLMSQGFHSKIRFNYDGTKSISGTYSYLDTLLTIVNGDSIGLFYRKDVSQDWQWLNKATKITNGVKTGYLELDSLMLGEYTFGNVADTSSLDIAEQKVATGQIKVYPNPAKQVLTVDILTKSNLEYTLEVFTLEGKLLLKKMITGPQNKIDISVLSKGGYLLEIKNSGRKILAQPLLIE